MYADASVNYVVPSKVTSLPVSPLFTTDTGGPRCMTLSLQQQCLLFSFERNSHYSGFFPLTLIGERSIVVSVSVCLFVRCVCVLRKLVLKRDQCLQEHSVDFWAFRCKNVLTEVSRLLTIRQRLTRVKL